MELILWRHAEAEMGEPDEGRSLTAKGHKQAWKMAEWLDHNLANSCRILVSPATRTVQTAEALGRKFKIVDDLGPESTAEKILAAAHWPNSREPVLVIGHQPTLGQVASLLITGEKQDWTIRKGNVWWIVQRERGETTGNYIRAVMTADLLTK
jgi:phosphohistidine phosphatase